jgi:excisionase family DNA binding protein
MSMGSEIMTTRQYAEQYGVSSSTVSKWIRSGKINAQKIGGKWFISPDQVVAQNDSPSGSGKNREISPAPPQSTSGDHYYSVEKFSALTYLTPFGVLQWLKDGRLTGIKDKSGQWQVHASNLENNNVKRLLRH